jgi:NitT/TauT family transport system ATP-binding protein
MNDVCSIVVSDLSVAYRSANRSVMACENVNFSTQPGEFIGIVGTSGCGKTTLLNAIAGFVKPTTGSVYVGGKLVQKPSANVTVVFQSYALFPWMTAHDNLYFGLRMKGMNRTEAAPQIEKYLAMIGLQGIGALYPYELSGGMQQRVALARALVIEPAIILMDEPFAAVDIQTREDLQDELAAIRGRTSQTVLLVTHSVDEAVYLSDRVIVMGKQPGRILATHDITLVNPRTRQIRSTTAFLSLRDAVSQELRNSTKGETHA